MAKNPGKTLFQTVMWLVAIPFGILTVLLVYVYGITALFTH